MLTPEVKIINEEIAKIKSIYAKLLEILPSFDITNAKLLPYGLKPHTRSISWIVEFTNELNIII